MDEITITNIECVLTKIRLEPGDVLLVRVNVPHSIADRERLQDSFGEAFGVPAVVMPNGVTLEAVLNMPPELIERAQEAGRRHQNEVFEAMRRQFGKKPEEVKQ